MNRKRLFLSALVAAILIALVVLQVHSWRKFDWAVFRAEISNVNWWFVLAGVALIYAVNTLRALRWAIFLRPVKHVKWTELVAAQFIGFSSLALLGRPAEFIRPYLTGRRVQMSLASQIAVWTVERLFDVGAVTVLLSLAIFASPDLRQLPAYHKIFEGGLILIAAISTGILVAVVLRFRGAVIAQRIEKAFTGKYSSLGNTICRRITAFSDGLNTIKDLRSFALLALISLCVWSMVAVCYLCVTYSYQGEPLRQLTFPDVILLMFFSIAGGTVQLPVVGGGSQLATIAALQSPSVFGFRPELATSCGILLWLVTFISVVPVGLLLAHREHVSMRALSKESQPMPSSG